MNDSVGVWLNSTLSRRVFQAAPVTLPGQSPSNISYGSTSLVQKVLVPALNQECLATIPPAAHLTALSKIYFEKMHPIFPVIDENLYHSLHRTDPCRILLHQSICLAASKNFAAKQHLFLGDSESALNSREFGDSIAAAMRLSMEIGLVTNKIVLILVLALMSQFIDAPDGGDLSSQLCARAVHHVQSIGWHLKAQRDEDSDQYGVTLLCCIWAIDRMNAIFNGRPVLMHERDLRNDLEQCFERQEPRFRLFIQVVVLLDKVIGLYRPSTNSNNCELEESFSSFEDLVVRCGCSQTGTSSLATIETFYHAVTILSCRSKIWAEPQRSSISYLRQSLSTSTLISTIGRELQDRLDLFPFVPYAFPLSLSIAYREMRHSKVPLHRARARTQFQTICEALSELKEVFRSAATTADMGKKLLKEMDRVASTVAASGTKTPQHHITQNNVCTDGPHSHIPASTPQNSNYLQADECQATMSNGLCRHVQPMQDFDPSIFDSVADIDLFGMFDPAFNLDGFDTCLENYFNPTFPTSFE